MKDILAATRYAQALFDIVRLTHQEATEYLVVQVAVIEVADQVRLQGGLQLGF